MTDSANEITLIVAGTAGEGQPPNESSDRAESRTPSLPSHAPEVVGQAVAVDAGLIRDNIDKCLAQLNQVFANLKRTSIDGWSVGSITVGLTVTAQGSVGIATAGVEASLQITFNPKP
jgi:hypothetical protein